MIALGMVIGLSSWFVFVIYGGTGRTQMLLVGVFITLALLGWTFTGQPDIGKSEPLAVAINGCVFLVLSRLKRRGCSDSILEREIAAKAFVGGTLGLLYIIWGGY